MKHGMTFEYPKCRANLNFEIDFYSKCRNLDYCDQVKSVIK